MTYDIPEPCWQVPPLVLLHFRDLWLVVKRFAYHRQLKITPNGSLLWSSRENHRVISSVLMSWTTWAIPACSWAPVLWVLCHVIFTRPSLLILPSTGTASFKEEQHGLMALSGSLNVLSRQEARLNISSMYLIRPEHTGTTLITVRSF